MATMPTDALSRGTISVSDSYHDLNSLNHLRELGRKDELAGLTAAARQFESFFLKTLIKTMREANEALGENELFDSEGLDFYQEMHDEQLAASLSAQDSLGLADLMVQQLSGGRSLNSTENLKPSRMPDVKVRETAAVTPTSATEFLRQLLPHAEAAAGKLSAPVETILAQSVLETGWGKSGGGAVQGPYLFGIKAGNDWQGDSLRKETLEVRSGVVEKIQASFRRYPDIKSAFDDYVQFLSSQPRYAAVTESNGSAERYAQSLQDSGYATDPGYAQKLLRIQHSELFRNALKEARQLLSNP